MFKTSMKATKVNENDPSRSNSSSVVEKRRLERQSSINNSSNLATAVTDAVHIQRELSENEGKTIDVAILDEDDDAICEEDYNRKRIILWLMKVRTGDEAEQKTREQTP